MREMMLTAAVLGSAMLGAPVTHAAVVDNFETYATDSTLEANGWVHFPGSGGTGSAVLDGAFAIEGSKSGYVSTRHLYSRGWGAASDQVGDGATLSWLVKQEVAASSGQTWFFLSDNFSAGSTPAGIILDHGTGIVRLYGTAETPTAFAYTPGTTYLFEMELDFTLNSFIGYATDVTNSGPRTLLGTQAFSDLDAATVAATGGPLLGNFGSGSAAFWDDVQVVIPEPASMALLGLGGLVLASRRTRR